MEVKYWSNLVMYPVKIDENPKSIQKYKYKQSKHIKCNTTKKQSLIELPNQNQLKKYKWEIRATIIRQRIYKHLTERINNVQNVNLKINLELKYPGIYF